MLKEASDHWSVSDSSELYEVPRWGKDYFSVHRNGHLIVHPSRDPSRGIDLKELVDRLQLRGIDLPILVRFNGILKDRLEEIDRAFATAIEKHQYAGKYSCVYPIKVNQQRQVVEQIVRKGNPLGFGLEAGSKPELLAVVAMGDNHTPIICNGFKDREFIEMALLAQKMGRQVIPVVERPKELDLILEYSAKIGVRPQIGMRIKLASRGSGRWQDSGGMRSKFGLTAGEVLESIEKLEQVNMLECFQLLHFHMGSQVTNIRQIKGALVEAAHVYSELWRRGAKIKYLDVGGGLGVDYDGSQTTVDSSVNYTLDEYASDVVYHIVTICDETGVPHPNLISESGRAVVAYHSVLISNVLGATSAAPEVVDDHATEDHPEPIRLLFETYRHLTVHNLLESHHDAQGSLDAAQKLFSMGHLSLGDRSLAEKVFWAICGRTQRLVKQLDFVPEELATLDRELAQTYFCNFSLFQSMPDSWAIKQLFPVMPIHRLDAEPTRHAVIGDITCDSDGKIDRFIDRRDVRETLMLHELDGQPYYLAAFLVGAYQEILGDMHNLFGDTHAVHVDLTDAGEVCLDAIIKGDTVAQVLDYVAFDRGDLINRLQAAVEKAVQDGKFDHSEAGYFLKFYETKLNGYTYLDDSQQEARAGGTTG